MIKSTQISEREVRARMWAAGATLIVSVFVLSLKFWAFNITRSQAIYSDALESIVNVVTAIVGLVVVYYASIPADEDHPYGHGKIEYFSAVFEGGLITFASIFIFYEAGKAQLEHSTLHSLTSGLELISLAGLTNLVMGFFLRRVGEEYASSALQSAGTHLFVDFWTTLGAIGGVALVKYTGLIWIDRVVALILGAYMLRSGIGLVYQSSLGLLDAEDIKILESLAKIFERYAGDGIIQIHHTKVIRSGWFHHIDAHLVVPEFWSVEKAHVRLDVFEEQVINAYQYGGEANFHLDPCKRKYCAVCDYNNCPVRVKPFESRMPVILEHLRSKTEPKGTY